jgi:hypothetical protein
LTGVSSDTLVGLRVKLEGVKERGLAGHVSEDTWLDLRIARARWGVAAMRQDSNWISRKTRFKYPPSYRQNVEKYCDMIFRSYRRALSLSLLFMSLSMSLPSPHGVSSFILGLGKYNTSH